MGLLDRQTTRSLDSVPHQFSFFCSLFCHHRAISNSIVYLFSFMTSVTVSLFSSLFTLNSWVTFHRSFCCVIKNYLYSLTKRLKLYCCLWLFLPSLLSCVIIGFRFSLQNPRLLAFSFVGLFCGWKKWQTSRNYRDNMNMKKIAGHHLLSVQKKWRLEWNFFSRLQLKQGNT